MLVIPIGSDANLRHKPVVTYVVVGLFAVITLAVWIAHPIAIVSGIPGLIEAQAVARQEAEWAAEEAAEKASEDAEIAAGHPTAATLARQLDLVTTPPRGRGKERITQDGQRIAEALTQHWITDAESAELRQKLAAAPVLAPEEGFASILGVDGDKRPPISDGERKFALEMILNAQDNNVLTASQGDALRKRVTECRIVGDAYPRLLAMIDPTAKRPIAAADRESIEIKIDYAKNNGDLDLSDEKELLAVLAKRGAVSSDVAERAVENVDDVPWYLAPVGAWSNPLRWPLAMCVHPRWNDAIFGIGFMWSFGVVVEGLIGWRRFLPVLGGGVLLACLWQQFTGLFAPAILIQAGSSELRAFFAGMLVMWVPTNVVSYVRWLFVVIGTFDVAIWKIVAFSTAAGLIGACFSGMPLVTALGGQILFPAAGLGVGYLLFQRGWVSNDGWDLLLLWETRHMNPGDRSTFVRNRDLGIPGVGSAMSDDEAAPKELLQEAEAAISESLTGGELDAALGMWRATRSGSPTWMPSATLLDRLLKATHQANRSTEATAVAEDLVRLYPDVARDARLVLASQALTAKLPATVRSHLAAIVPAQMTPTAKAQCDRLLARASALEASGIREIEFV